MGKELKHIQNGREHEITVNNDRGIKNRKGRK